MAVNKRHTLNVISQYTPAKSKESIKRNYGIEHLIKLAGNENRMGISPKAKEAIHSYISDDEQVSLYPDGNVTVLREKIAAKLNINEEQLIFGNGSFELISIIAQTYLEEGDESIYSVPTFNWYKNVTRIAGAVPVEVPTTNLQVDLDKIEEKITARTKIIWICNPNNPTGTKVQKCRFERFLNEVRKDILVVLDEAYIEFVEDEDYINSAELIQKYDNLIALRTFSKLYGLAGFRIGYGFADTTVIQELYKSKVPINVNALSQAAAIASIDDKDFALQVIENNRKGLSLYYEILEKLGLEYIKSNANFILLDTGIESKKVELKFLKHGILIRSASEFGLPTWVRISIGTYEDNVKVLKILQEILRNEKEEFHVKD